MLFLNKHSFTWGSNDSFFLCCLTCDIKGLNAVQLCVLDVCDDIFLEQDVLIPYFKSDIRIVKSCMCLHVC